MSKKKPQKEKIDPAYLDFALHKKARCPKCGTKAWSAIKTKVINGIIKIVSCDLCPSFWEHH
jgi:transcription elongation factor Elf1